MWNKVNTCLKNLNLDDFFILCKFYIKGLLLCVLSSDNSARKHKEDNKITGISLYVTYI